MATMIEERRAVMAHHFHHAFDRLTVHLPTKLRKGISRSRSSRSPSPEEKHMPKSKETLTRPPTPPDFRLNDKYTQLKDLDAGDEGECAVVKSQSSGRVYVRKHTGAPSPPATRRPAHLSPPRPANSGRRRPIPPEARMLTHLQPPHPNIIRYFAVEASPHGLDRYNIILELCSGGDLLDQLRTFRDQSTRPGPTAPVVLTLHLLVSLSQALAYLHHGLRWKKEQTYEETKPWEPVIHGDIKPDNIFLRHSPQSQVKGLPDIVLGDFGMAHFACQSTGITGTPGYDSPEVRQIAVLRESDPYAYQHKCQARIMTTKSDVYQMGLILYLMSTGRHFKVGADPGAIQLCEEYGSIKGFTSFLVWCLQPEPKDRPECTNDVVEGCLFAVDMFMQKRDKMVAEGVLDGLKDSWHAIKFDDRQRGR